MKSLAFALVLAALAAGSAHAQSVSLADRLAVDVGGGTNGGVVEAAFSLNRYLVVHGQGAFIEFGHDFSSSGTRYHGELRQFTGGATADLHPFHNPFLLSGGFVSGERKVRVDANPVVTATVTVAGVRSQISEAVPVRGDIDLGSTAPFAGLGFDNTFTHRGHWGFRAVAGVLFGDTPRARLSTSTPLADDPTLGPVIAAALANEQRSVQHDINGYRYYPIAQVGVSYRF